MYFQFNTIQPLFTVRLASMLGISVVETCGSLVSIDSMIFASHSFSLAMRQSWLLNSVPVVLFEKDDVGADLLVLAVQLLKSFAQIQQYQLLAADYL